VAGINYVGWNCFDENIDKSRRIDNSVSCMKEIIKAAEDYDIVYGFEVTNRFEQFMLNTAAEAVAYCRRVESPYARVQLDINHMLIEEDDIYGAVVTAGKLLSHMHVAESNRRVPKGGGFVPWGDLARGLKDIGYDRIVSLEPLSKLGGKRGPGREDVAADHSRCQRRGIGTRHRGGVALYQKRYGRGAAMRLQIALDCKTTAEALRTLEETEAFVDIIEAGTPLIVSEGLAVVREIRRRYPRKTLLADVKIMDAGAFEAEMTFEAGADIATVMGAAGDETIAQAAWLAHREGKLLAADMLGVKRSSGRCVEAAALGVDIVYLHTSFDEFGQAPPPLPQLMELKRLNVPAQVAVTGGVTLENIDGLIALRPDIIVVGRSITQSQDRVGTAKAFREQMCR
jgi:3-hexulose-6-phosphate synthase